LDRLGLRGTRPDQWPAQYIDNVDKKRRGQKHQDLCARGSLQRAMLRKPVKALRHGCRVDGCISINMPGQTEDAVKTRKPAVEIYRVGRIRAGGAHTRPDQATQAFLRRRKSGTGSCMCERHVVLGWAQWRARAEVLRVGCQ
jgi:hypothetical protein